MDFGHVIFGQNWDVFARFHCLFWGAWVILANHASTTRMKSQHFKSVNIVNSSWVHYLNNMALCGRPPESSGRMNHLSPKRFYILQTDSPFQELTKQHTLHFQQGAWGASSKDIFCFQSIIPENPGKCWKITAQTVEICRDHPVFTGQSHQKNPITCFYYYYYFFFIYFGPYYLRPWPLECFSFF